VGISIQRVFPATFLVFLSMAGHLLGQTGGSRLQQGNHSIEIHVVGQSGAPLGVMVRVEVLSNSGFHMAEGYSNREQGVTDFEGFSDGLFQVRITGPDIEPTTQRFQIAATEATHREYIRVELKQTNSGSEAASSDDLKVSAQDLAVPRRARAEFEKGMEANAKADYKAAQNALERAVALYPPYVKAHNNLGVLYQKAGLNDKARAEYSKAVAFDPKFVPGYVNLAKVSIVGGDLAETEAELKKALDVEPGAVHALLLMCSTEFARNELAEALATAHRIHELTQDPQYAEAHLISARILISQGKPEAAAAEYRTFMKERPDDPRSESLKSLIARLSSR
jgi:Tfp pilus assembly protein PilF